MFSRVHSTHEEHDQEADNAIDELVNADAWRKEHCNCPFQNARSRTQEEVSVRPEAEDPFHLDISIRSTNVDMGPGFRILGSCLFLIRFTNTFRRQTW